MITSASPNGEKSKHNQDIYISNKLISKFEQIFSPLESKIVKDSFYAPETIANSYKKYFNVFGLISLSLVIVVLIFTVWRFTSATAGYSTNSTAVWVIAVLGFFSFLIAIISHFGKFQEKWLLNRFKTERLRQFKFQQLLDGKFMELSKNAPTKFENELQSRFTKFQQSYINELGSFGDFIDGENFQLFVKPNISSDVELSNQIFEAYYTFRLEYQFLYFKDKQKDLLFLDDSTKSIAKFSLLTAFLLALAELIILLIHNVDLEKKLSWIIGAFAISAGLLSAGVRVFRSAKAISEENERYTSKWVVLKILSEKFNHEKSTPEEKLQVMNETERISIEELREFLRTFKKSDYLL